MKRHSRTGWIIGVVAALALAAAGPVFAQESLAGADQLLPGVGLAEGISQVTGVAISPLLGVCGVGTWKYFTTPAESRHLLPWIYHPLAWGIGYFVLSLCFLKDILGTATPAILKKPLDLIELFEDKLSALLASTAFVPLVAWQVSNTLSESSPPGATSALGHTTDALIASVPVSLGILASGLAWILIPLAILGFFVVWLMSHAVNVLLLLSPFGAIDFAMKLSKVALMALMALLYLISPVVAAILAVVIIAVAAWLAPATFRLCVFGSVMSMDYLRSLIWKTRDVPKVYGFLARPAENGLRARSFGSVRKGESGETVFVSRFLFLGPARKLELPDSGCLAVRRGFLFPSVTVTREDGKGRQAVIHLLPRYRHAIEELAAHIGVSEVSENAVVRSMKSVRGWIRDTLRPAPLSIETKQET